MSRTFAAEADPNPDRSAAPARPRWIRPGLGRDLETAVFTASAVAATLVLTLFFLLGIAWSSTDRLVVEEIPRPEARVALAPQFRQAFGVDLPGDARLLRARRRSSSFRGDGDEWFLLQLPPGRGAALEADLRAGSRNRNLGPVESRRQRPSRRDDGDGDSDADGDADDWTRFPPPGAQVWLAEDDRHTLMIRHDRFFLRWVR